jgi:CRISPR/Cas system Type II protein with McrA/HNH and RuvC-like nuclease domain
MSAKQKHSPASTTAKLQLAFDVGHSSIGWAVLQPTGEKSLRELSINLLGCGAVTYQADDCLASARRMYRRQRRHIRSTRQRIARLKVLLAKLSVLNETQLNNPGCAWPWLLAARVLAGGKLLTWPELWAVLRWYAHNRGYDGKLMARDPSKALKKKSENFSDSNPENFQRTKACLSFPTISA